MNILAITKFPPIQGGESTKAFFLFNELANRGHCVTVLTNYTDVSNRNRAVFSESDFAFLRSNRNLDIVDIGAESTPTFIPQYDPKTEKLINEGLKLIVNRKFDIIYGWYLLPYCSVAYLISKITAIPFIIQHAGSDLTNIYTNNNLHYYFNQIIRSASGVCTFPSVVSSLGDKPPEDILLQDEGFPDMYTPEGSQVSFKDSFNVECDVNSTFLCLGKFSTGKGFYEIAETFRLIGEATLIIFTPNKKNVNVDLPKNVFLLDAVAPWRVPEILRSAKALIVPEWNFDVAIHRSTLPIEAILCGRPALVSHQVIRKYSSLSRFMIGIDPTDAEGTTSKIRGVIRDDFSNETIRKNYRKIRAELPSFAQYVGKTEAFLEKKINKETK